MTTRQQPEEMPPSINTAMSPSSTLTPKTKSIAASFFGSAAAVYGAAAVLRVVLLVYGLWQDANSPVKYTDIDYLVFTDASRFVHSGRSSNLSGGGSPYDRETYRYTPLLAWLLLPTAVTTSNAALNQLLFASGKILFAAADLVAGYLLEHVLRQQFVKAGNIDATQIAVRSRIYSSVWLLNPMVAAISTRGSAEGLLGALVAALLYAVQVVRSPLLSGLLLGAGVHLKIYPFIYAPAIVWWMDDDEMRATPKSKAASSKASASPSSKSRNPLDFVTLARVQLAVSSLVTFLGLNAVMYLIYGTPFIQHTYLHHVTRIDHRHNFSPYNTQLYLSSARVGTNATSSKASSLPPIESLAFFPQLLLATVLLPLVIAKKDLATTMLAQTFAFVTFNKVCTSQYFLWYMVLLPVYLPRSTFIKSPRIGIAALVLWILGQAAWLQQGFALEFLGQSTFVPGLWFSSLGFFLVNCWILGVIVEDAGQ